MACSLVLSFSCSIKIATVELFSGCTRTLTVAAPLARSNEPDSHVNVLLHTDILPKQEPSRKHCHAAIQSNRKVPKQTPRRAPPGKARSLDPRCAALSREERTAVSFGRVSAAPDELLADFEDGPRIRVDELRDVCRPVGGGQMRQENRGAAVAILVDMGQA
jgi:hypothetical protein